MAGVINIGYRNKLEELAKELGTFTVERLRKFFIETNNEFISWNTVRGHLNLMVKEERVEEHIITKGKRRTISFFKFR